MIDVTVFGKPGCHLCEAMLQMVQRVGDRERIELVARNILENATDLERYGQRIPVLRIDGKEVADFRIGEKDFLNALHGAENSRQQMLRSTALIVMAKYPAAGKVKTRLSPELTPGDAARVHGEFLQHLLQRLGGMRFGKLLVCFDPPDAGDSIKSLCSVAAFVPQVDGDLGARLSAAARGHERALFLGVDSPDVPQLALLHAGHQLQNHDVVLGPTEDGGFWCLGISKNVNSAQLLSEIDWSSGREFDQTLHRAGSLGYNVGLADSWSDVDRPDDLRRLIARLRAASDPQDKQLLRRLSFLPPPDGAHS